MSNAIHTVLKPLLACCFGSKTYHLCMITQLDCIDVLCFDPFWAEVHTGGCSHKANSIVRIKEAAECRSKQLCRGEVTAEITCGAPRFQLAWCQSLDGA